MSTSPGDRRLRFYEHYFTTHVKPDDASLGTLLSTRAPYIRSIIRRWLPGDRGSHILDMACGYGALLYFLSEFGYKNIEGVDLSPEQVTSAHQLGLSFVRHGSIWDVITDSEPNTYDVLIAFDLLEHFSREEALLLIDAAYSMLKAGGRFIIHVPNGEAIFSGAVLFGDITHETCYTRRSISQILQVAGFRRVQVIEDSPVVHGLKSAARYVIWKAARTVFSLIYSSETGEHPNKVVLSQNFLAIACKE